MSALTRRIDAARRLADRTDNPAEKAAALAAVVRLDARVRADPFSSAPSPGPRAVALLRPYQRDAMWLSIASCHFTLKERRFIGDMCRARSITPRQREWLALLVARAKDSCNVGA